MAITIKKIGEVKNKLGEGQVWEIAKANGILDDLLMAIGQSALPDSTPSA